MDQNINIKPKSNYNIEEDDITEITYKKIFTSIEKRNKNPISILNEMLQKRKKNETFVFSQNIHNGYTGYVGKVTAQSFKENKLDAKIDIVIKIISRLTEMEIDWVLNNVDIPETK